MCLGRGKGFGMTHSSPFECVCNLWLVCFFSVSSFVFYVLRENLYMYILSVHVHIICTCTLQSVPLFSTTWYG